MNRVASAPHGAFRGVGSWMLLGVVGGLLGYLSDLPHYGGVALVVFAVGLGGVLQRVRPRSVRSFAPLPVVAGIATVAIASPLGLVPELVAGVSGIAVLLWLADDPGRPAGGVGRAQTALSIPALALGIAWASAFLLPSSSASLGVAVGLLVFVIAAVAYLFGRPTLIDREEPLPS